jgi:hypothetical protein
VLESSRLDAVMIEYIVMLLAERPRVVAIEALSCVLKRGKAMVTESRPVRVRVRVRHLEAYGELSLRVRVRVRFRAKDGVRIK